MSSSVQVNIQSLYLLPVWCFHKVTVTVKGQLSQILSGTVSLQMRSCQLADTGEDTLVVTTTPFTAGVAVHRLSLHEVFHPCQSNGEHLFPMTVMNVGNVDVSWTGTSPQDEPSMASKYFSASGGDRGSKSRKSLQDGRALLAQQVSCCGCCNFAS